MTTRPALGPCVSFKLDEDTHLKLVNAKERSGRSKAGEVVLRVKITFYAIQIFIQL
ncbi:TPA: TraY domain-containing protein [Klebsiella pneumoniae]